MAIVTLLTDYGLADTYVGQLKASVLAMSRDALLVDLTHQVPAHDGRAGAFLLWSAVEAFPPGTVHLAVVDPGVGSARRPIALRSKRGDLFVGPNTGLLIPAAERLGGVDASVVLENDRYFSARRSTTFHGRDVFGPVAGHLANGISLDWLGPRVGGLDRSFVIPSPQRIGAAVVGEVIHVDAFGNLITNIPSAMLTAPYEVRLKDADIFPQSNYAAVARGALLALVGGNGLLEISAREENAAEVLGVERGEPVEVEPA